MTNNRLVLTVSNDEELAQAIEKVRANGGGTIHLGNGNYTAPLDHLPSNLHIVGRPHYE